VKRTTPPLLLLLLLLVLVLGGLASLLLSIPTWRQRPVILWFPVQRTEILRPELRLTARQVTVTEEIDLVLEELILGPQADNLSPLVQPTVKYRIIQGRDDLIYIDLTSDLLFGKANAEGIRSFSTIPAKQIIAVFERVLRTTFRNHRFVITIDGHEADYIETLAILDAKFDNLIDKGVWLTIIKTNTDTNVRAL